MKVDDIQTRSVLGTQLKRFLQYQLDSKEKQRQQNHLRFTYGKTEIKLQSDNTISLISHSAFHKTEKVIPTSLSEETMKRLECFCLKHQASNISKVKEEVKKIKNDSSSDDDIYSDLEEGKDFKQLEQEATAKQYASKEQVQSLLDSAQDMDIDELFQEDPEVKNKFKAQLPPQTDREYLVYDYFEQNSKNQQIMKKNQSDPMNKGFDIRQFRLKQAAIRQKQEEKEKGMKGLGKYTTDDNFGVAMPNMVMDKADKIVIDSSKVIEQFNNEDQIKKDEEWMHEQKRSSFAFGGQSVRDRIKRRKATQKLSNEVSKIDKILTKRSKKEKGDGSEEEEGEDVDGNNGGDDGGGNSDSDDEDEEGRKRPRNF